MRIDGQAMSGGPIATRGIPAPTSPLARPGSDIISRLEATRARVSPVGSAGDDAESRTYQLGTSRRPVGHRFDPVEIAARYRRGDSAPTIAKALGCTTTTVYGALRDQRVPTRQARRRVADDD